MSAQLIEVLFLAAIAFLIISKFISILGTSDEDDPARNSKSFFGEPRGMKDVTGTVSTPDESRAKSILKITKKLKKHAMEHMEYMKAIYEVFPNFDVEKFLKGAKSAFSMIVTALQKKDLQTIEDLVDKRYIEQIKEMSNIYGSSGKKLEASIIDTYSLGNSVYVKVLFKGSTSKLKTLKEEWVFTKNIQQTGPDWYLCNIER